MNEARNTTSLGWNTDVDTIDLVDIDEEGTPSFIAHICPAHPVAVQAVIDGLIEIKKHLEDNPDAVHYEVPNRG